jgi:hypothetical protein
MKTIKKGRVVNYATFPTPIASSAARQSSTEISLERQDTSHPPNDGAPQRLVGGVL